ncbi:solute carrier family 15 (oligopeptide transporter), member 1 [Pancytospora epiphaga]|nr:solute carrier family 15 (oligopeptide transporter), member 1 [Pancytospora epiphaga]
MISKHKVLSLIMYNESSERFCFYGLRSLLFLFLRTRFNLSYINALLVVHTFLALSYSLPVVIGIVLEILIGSYKTIVNLSAIYFIGTIILAHCAIFPDDLALLLISLFMISIGIGGLKPCITMSNNEGVEETASIIYGAVAKTESGKEQPRNTSNLRRLQMEIENDSHPSSSFKCLYFVLYVCAALSVIWSPILADISCFGSKTCYVLPFGMASVLLGCAILLLIFGSRYFNYTRKNHSAYRKIYKLLSAKITKFVRKYLFNEHWITHDTITANTFENTSEFKTACKLMRFFLPAIFFWLLVEQQYTNWVEQGLNMKSTLANELREVSVKLPIMNSLAMILFIPLITGSIYISLRIMGYRIGTLYNASIALLLGALSFFVSALIEYKMIISEHKISIMYQLPQYALMALAELVMGMSGISSLYKETTEELKEAVLCVWLFMIAAANLTIVLVSYICMRIGGNKNNSQLIMYILFGVLGVFAAVRLHRALKEYKEEIEDNRQMSLGVNSVM